LKLCAKDCKGQVSITDAANIGRTGIQNDNETSQRKMLTTGTKFKKCIYKKIPCKFAAKQ
jgi:hypothetical protein